MYDCVKSKQSAFLEVWCVSNRVCSRAAGILLMHTTFLSINLVWVPLFIYLQQLGDEVHCVGRDGVRQRELALHDMAEGVPGTSSHSMLMTSTTIVL